MRATTSFFALFLFASTVLAAPIPDDSSNNDRRDFGIALSAGGAAGVGLGLAMPNGTPRNPATAATGSGAMDMGHSSGAAAVSQKPPVPAKPDWLRGNPIVKSDTEKPTADAAPKAAVDETPKAIDESTKAVDDTSKAVDDSPKAVDETPKAVDETPKGAVSAGAKPERPPKSPKRASFSANSDAPSSSSSAAGAGAETAAKDAGDAPRSAPVRSATMSAADMPNTPRMRSNSMPSDASTARPRSLSALDRPPSYASTASRSESIVMSSASSAAGDETKLGYSSMSPDMKGYTGVAPSHVASSSKPPVLPAIAQQGQSLSQSFSSHLDDIAGASKNVISHAL